MVSTGPGDLALPDLEAQLSHTFQVWWGENSSVEVFCAARQQNIDLTHMIKVDNSKKKNGKEMHLNVCCNYRLSQFVTIITHTFKRMYVNSALPMPSPGRGQARPSIFIHF